MRPITFYYTLVLFAFSLNIHAETVHFKTPAISGKLLANNIELTDWQTVMSCHFNSRGQKKESIRYPQTTLTKREGSIYSLKINIGLLNKSLPNWELQNCSYKLILIGKNISTHQLAFGEIYLLGKDVGVMSQSELQSLQDIHQVTKSLNYKTRELTITNGKDGGIVEEI